MHPNRGTDRAIEDAINAIRTTNTRKPPDKISSSEESDQHADNESSSCHGGSSEMDADSFDEILAEIQHATRNFPYDGTMTQRKKMKRASAYSTDNPLPVQDRDPVATGRSLPATTDWT